MQNKGNRKEVLSIENIHESANLSHRAEYDRQIESNKKLALISLAAAIISIVPVLTIVKSNGASTFLFSVFLLAIIFSITFSVAILSAKSRSKTTGNFEAIDVIGNSIVYQNELLGVKVIEPSQIEKLLVKRYSQRGGDNAHFITIYLVDCDKPIKVSTWISNYGGFVQKMKRFKVENNL